MNNIYYLFRQLENDNIYRCIMLLLKVFKAERFGLKERVSYCGLLITMEKGWLWKSKNLYWQFLPRYHYATLMHSQLLPNLLKKLLLLKAIRLATLHAGGQSGSGVLDTGAIVRGIHTNGFLTTTGNNKAKKIDSTTFNTIVDWLYSY